MQSSISNLAQTGALVLLYHATFSNVPTELQNDLHNIHPDVLRTHIEYLSEFYCFVSVDELAAMSDPRGFAAVTFDDGYRCVFDETMPLLESLGVPFTVFLNSGNFEGAVFWRDKVRLISSLGLIAEFEAFMDGIDSAVDERFYRYTKSPRNNSEVVDRQLDLFLESQCLEVRGSGYCVTSLEELPDSAYVNYGNHSHRHYVLSSLLSTEQNLEIKNTKNWLDKLPAEKCSGIFSVPFGALGDFDERTVAALKENNYDKVLLSRNRLHTEFGLHAHGIAAIERFMPRSSEKDAGLSFFLA